jgi:type I restriction-modification system DNA methylase subunit
MQASIRIMFFSFCSNRAGNDDLLGDAYEFLMRNFAQQSGKSKGQFYTPSEVSRVIAKVIGIDHKKISSEDDPFHRFAGFEEMWKLKFGKILLIRDILKESLDYLRTFFMGQESLRVF